MNCPICDGELKHSKNWRMYHVECSNRHYSCCWQYIAGEGDVWGLKYHVDNLSCTQILNKHGEKLYVDININTGYIQDKIIPIDKSFLKRIKTILMLI